MNELVATSNIFTNNFVGLVTTGRLRDEALGVERMQPFIKYINLSELL
jgi:hypothetical protein